MNPPWRVEKALPESEFAAIRRRAMFQCCKWDPQVVDVPSLCNFPLILTALAWDQIARIAENLDQETLAAEAELMKSPNLHYGLGLSSRLRFALNSRRVVSAARIEPRVMRFDFHYTRDGWRISEVNSDVPGGFIEASAFTQLFAALYPGTRPAGDPACAYVDALQRVVNAGRGVALIHATAYVDDRQVMIYLARLLSQRGIPSYLASPGDVVWRSGHAWIVDSQNIRPVDAIMRFFPAEWLPNLNRLTDWRRFFCGSQTPMSNPGTAILTQTKRFPLVWDKLKTPMSNWRAALPETVDPRDVPWKRDDNWILKPALGRVGEAIGIQGVTTANEWRMISRNAQWWPRHWIAQRRFDAVPISYLDQPFYPVLGVYVIEGKACGIYGRLARRPLIDNEAQDIAILIEREPRAKQNG